MICTGFPQKISFQIERSSKDFKKKKFQGSFDWHEIVIFNNQMKIYFDILLLKVIE